MDKQLIIFMSAGNYEVVEHAGPTRSYQVDDRTTSSQTAEYEVGEPLKAGAANPYVIALATGDPEIGTDQFVGITAQKSTETSTADGTVLVTTCIPVKTMLNARATTTANVDTQAEIDALVNDWVCGDLSGTGTNGSAAYFYIDEDEGDDPNVHAFQIQGGDPVSYRLDFIVHAMASIAAPYL